MSNRNWNCILNMIKRNRFQYKMLYTLCAAAAPLTAAYMLDIGRVLVCNICFGSKLCGSINAYCTRACVCLHTGAWYRVALKELDGNL